jgi:hypothetical protein
MGRLLASTFAILVIAVLSGVAAESSLVLAGRQSTSHEVVPRATTVNHQVVIPIPVVSAPVSIPPPVTTPIVVPAPTQSAPVTSGYKASINGFVHMRADRSATSAIITNLYAGYIVHYSAIDSGKWQAITYNGQPGFVYKDYISY